MALMDLGVACEEIVVILLAMEVTLIALRSITWHRLSLPCESTRVIRAGQSRSSSIVGAVQSLDSIGMVT